MCNLSQENVDVLLVCGVTENKIYLVEFALNNGANVNLKKNNIYDALPDVTEKYVKKYCSIGGICFSSPLHLATLKNYFDIAEVLIEKGADVNFQDSLGNTPLHTSACYKDVNFILLLLSNDTDTSITNKRGYLPLHTAVENTLFEVEGKEYVAVALLYEEHFLKTKNLDDETSEELARLDLLPFEEMVYKGLIEFCEWYKKYPEFDLSGRVEDMLIQRCSSIL